MKLHTLATTKLPLPTKQCGNFESTFQQQFNHNVFVPCPPNWTRMLSRVFHPPLTCREVHDCLHERENTSLNFRRTTEVQFFSDVRLSNQFNPCGFDTVGPPRLGPLPAVSTVVRLTLFTYRDICFRHLWTFPHSSNVSTIKGLTYSVVTFLINVTLRLVLPSVGLFPVSQRGHGEDEALAFKLLPQPFILPALHTKETKFSEIQVARTMHG